MRHHLILGALTAALTLLGACIEPPTNQNNSSAPPGDMAHEDMADAGAEEDMPGDMPTPLDVCDMPLTTPDLCDMTPEPCPQGCQEGQVCDVATDTCVACLMDSDCEEGVCDADTNTCVGCLMDDDCDASAGEVCDEQARACVECTADDECDEGVCDETTQACVECTGDGECGAGEVCDEQANVCVECTEDSACQGELVCEPTAQVCVECTETDDCAAGVCDPQANTCVECLMDEHCPDPTAARCDQQVCTGCVDSSSCAHFDDVDLAVCDAGTCLGCRVTEEATDCGAKACDPLTLTCTDTDRGSVAQGGHCRADSECANGNCVELSLPGGGVQTYCLEVFDGMTPCPLGWRTLIDAPSISGAPVATYCAVNINLTTPEAVLDALNDKTCTVDGDCGRPMTGDGRCNIAGDGNTYCTYPCDRNLECRTTCSTSNTCQL